MTTATKCTVRDGLFVEPCKSLNEMAEFGNPPRGKQRGIYEWRFTNVNTHKPARHFFGAKSTAEPKGLAFNFCPWCGTDISAPFMPASQNRRSQSEAQKQDKSESVSEPIRSLRDTDNADSKESGNG